MSSAKDSIKIAGRSIGRQFPPYVIAEMSANHNGSLDAALKLIDAVAEAGADAVKLQTYRADTITLPSIGPDFQINDGLWAGRTLYELYESAQTPWEWHAALFERAAKHGLTIFSSPFDVSAVDFLNQLDVPAFKIASFEAVDIPLIRYVASKGKPMIISTGMADEEEIADALEAAQTSGCEDIILLHCVSGYPAPAADYNLATILDMQQRYGVLTGLSDHTLENVTAIAAIACGSVIIEKHVTLDRRGGGPDDSFSLEPRELRSLCEDVRTAWKAIGKVDYGRKSSEKGNVKFRRSLYFVTDVAKGQRILPEMVRSVRPGYGLPPKYLDEVLGKKALTDIRRYTPVMRELID